MKYIILIVIVVSLISCTRLLIGEKKLTYNESTPYVKPSASKIYKKDKFYVIPLEKIKECRGYPAIKYVGSENKYSFFWLVSKLNYRDEIALVAVPDSICSIQEPSTLNDENKTHHPNGILRDTISRTRWARIEGNKIVVGEKKMKEMYWLK